MQYNFFQNQNPIINFKLNRIQESTRATSKAQISNPTVIWTTLTHCKSLSKALPRSTTTLSKRSMIESALRKTSENCISITYARRLQLFRQWRRSKPPTLPLSVPHSYNMYRIWARNVCVCGKVPTNKTGKLSVYIMERVFYWIIRRRMAVIDSFARFSIWFATRFGFLVFRLLLSGSNACGGVFEDFRRVDPISAWSLDYVEICVGIEMIGGNLKCLRSNCGR